MEKITFCLRDIYSINGQYFSELVIQKKVLEFANLVQGKDFIRVCKENFTVGAFCTLVLVTEEARVYNFFCGRKSELRSKIVMVPKIMITEVIDSATIKELVFEYEAREGLIATRVCQPS